MRIVYIVLLSIITNHYANAQSLPANPWASGSVETYAVSAPQPKNSQNMLPNARQSAASVSESVNVLMEYLSSASTSQQPTLRSSTLQTSKKPAVSAPNNLVLMQFLQNITGSDNASPQTNTAPQAKTNVPVSNPITDAQTAYNQYMNDLRQKIDDATHKAKNSYNNAVSSAKNIIQTTRKNLLKR